MVEEANSSCGLKQTSEFGSLTSLQVYVATHGNLVDDITMAEYKKPFLFLLLSWTKDLTNAGLSLCAILIARKRNKFEWRRGVDDGLTLIYYIWGVWKFQVHFFSSMFEDSQILNLVEMWGLEICT